MAAEEGGQDETREAWWLGGWVGGWVGGGGRWRRRREGGGVIELSAQWSDGGHVVPLMEGEMSF